MLDPRIEKIRKEYDLSKDDFWKLPQGRDVWLVKHAALEVVAAKAGIVFEDPQIIEANGKDGVVALFVRGHLDKRSMWSTGEANPKNCKTSYPWAIAEKRAIDRVVLKLVGLHGLVYSEEESDDFKPSSVAEISPPAKSSASLKKSDENGKDAWSRLTDELNEDLVDCHSIAALAQLRATYREKARAERWPRAWLDALANEFDTFEEKLNREAIKNNGYAQAAMAG